MYEEHPYCTPPPSNAVLWRYMSFIKYLSLLDRKALFFGRVDKLGDPFEGSVPKTDIESRPGFYKRYPSGQREHLMTSFSNTVKEGRKDIVVNCWHENEIESDFIWKIYSTENEGVAIVSDFKDLSSSLICQELISIGRVKYIDYDTESIGDITLYSTCLHKRKSFEHEREVRAIGAYLGKETDKGPYFDVNLSTLVHKVFVAPYANDWFLQLVESVTDRYGLQVPVCRSTMADSPNF